MEILFGLIELLNLIVIIRHCQKSTNAVVTTATVTINRMDTSVAAMLDTRESIAKLVFIFYLFTDIYNNLQLANYVSFAIEGRHLLLVQK